MKKVILLSIIIILSIRLFGQEANGIIFQSGDDWQGLLKEAKEKNKIIFIDAFATWCAPCKMMAKQVFTREDVGKFYNEHFICTKIDMEKGDGMYLRAKFQVSAYPTYLFVNGNEEAVHRAIGYREPKDFLKIGADAIDTLKQFISYEKKYNAGNRNPDFLYNYAFASYEAGTNADAIAQEYFKTQEEKNLTSLENFKAIQYFTNDINTREFKYLIENQELFISKYTAQDVEEKIDKVFVNAFYQIYRKNNKINIENEIDKMLEPFNIKNKEEQKFRIKLLIEQYIFNNWEEYIKTASNYIEKYVLQKPEKKNELINIIANINANVKDSVIINKFLTYLTKDKQLYVKMSGYFKDSDWDNYIKTAMLYFNKYSMLDPMITNDIAWTLTQKTDNKDILHKTETIIAELLKQHADYETFDTYAFILFKLEKKDEAKKAAETAIELAKKSNKDFSSTLELLDKLK